MSLAHMVSPLRTHDIAFPNSSRSSRSSGRCEARLPRDEVRGPDRPVRGRSTDVPLGWCELENPQNHRKPLKPCVLEPQWLWGTNQDTIDLPGRSSYMVGEGSRF